MEALAQPSGPTQLPWVPGDTPLPKHGSSVLAPAPLSPLNPEECSQTPGLKP